MEQSNASDEVSMKEAADEHESTPLDSRAKVFDQITKSFPCSMGKVSP